MTRIFGFIAVLYYSPILFSFRRRRMRGNYRIAYFNSSMRSRGSRAPNVSAVRLTQSACCNDADQRPQRQYRHAQSISVGTAAGNDARATIDDPSDKRLQYARGSEAADVSDGDR